MSYFLPHIDAMTGYVPGEQPRDRTFIKLNTNENPYAPSPRVAEAIGELAAGMAAGHFDMVAVGRALIGDPDFVAKVADGNHAAIRTFRRDDLGKLEWDLSIVEEAHSA